MTGKLGHVGYELTAEVGDKVVRVHANRLRRISDRVMETGDPQDGMFRDSLWTLGRIAGTMMRKNVRTQEVERHFRIRISGSRATSWTPESDLPQAVVKLYDPGDAARRNAKGPTAPDTTDGTDTITDESVSAVREDDVGLQLVVWTGKQESPLVPAE